MTTPFSNAITITGATGVGTTTTLKNLSLLFATDKRMRFVSAGDIMRLYADKEKMGIDGFVADEVLHEKKSFDEKCDNEIQAFGEQNYTIIEGRLVHAFVPRAFHVLQTCPLELRAWRLHRNHERNRSNLSLEQVRDMILRRDENDRRRWDRIYIGHDWPESDFDLVVCSTMNEIDLMRTIEVAWMEWVKRLSTTHGYRMCWTVR